MIWRAPAKKAMFPWWERPACKRYGFEGNAVLIMARHLFDMTPAHAYANDRDHLPW